MTPSGRDRHIVRLEGRGRRRDEERRYVQRQAAMDALSDDQLERFILLGRRCWREGQDPLSAEETAELDAVVAPIIALYEPDDELP